MLPLPPDHPLASARFFLLDMDGTFFIGDHLIDGAQRFLDVLARQGKDYLFLTNNSSSRADLYAAKFARIGADIPVEKIFTSGEATAHFLTVHHPGAKLAVFGTPALEDEFRQHSFELDASTPDVIVLGFDTTLTYAKLWRLCDLVRVGLPYVATHPDFNCPTETGFMPDIGSMIAFVKASTGRDPDHIIGKPNRAIVDAVLNKFGLQRSDLVMIGDRLYTDIALGQAAGISALLVLSGETQMDDVALSPYNPEGIFENLGAVADWLESNGIIFT